MNKALIYFLLLGMTFQFFACSQEIKSQNKTSEDPVPSQKEIKKIDSAFNDTLDGWYDSSYFDNKYYSSSCTDSIISNLSSYTEFKQTCINTRLALNRQYGRLNDSLKPAFLDSVGNLWADLIMNGGFPFWQGTPWTFEGHTPTPQLGTVACGYLVSTLLRHSDIKINRYKLAQLAATDGARSLLGNKNIPPLLDYNQAWKTIDTLSAGLYKVGLANHVGFLWVKDGETYFVHSNFIEFEGVICEYAKCSAAFNASTVFQIVPLSGNHFLIDKWLRGAQFEIIKNS